jgi:hypothetical protein
VVTHQHPGGLCLARIRGQLSDSIRSLTRGVPGDRGVRFILRARNAPELLLELIGGKDLLCNTAFHRDYAPSKRGLLRAAGVADYRSAAEGARTSRLGLAIEFTQLVSVQEYIRSRFLRAA